MPYKNAEERRAKQREYKQKIRKVETICGVSSLDSVENTVIKKDPEEEPPGRHSITEPDFPNEKEPSETMADPVKEEPEESPPITSVSSQTKHALSSQPPVAPWTLQPLAPRRPWGITCNGVFIPLEVTPDMPLAYR